MVRMTLFSVSREYIIMMSPDSWGWLRGAAPQISASQRGLLSFQFAYEFPFFTSNDSEIFLVYVHLCFYSLTFWRHSSDYSSGYNLVTSKQIVLYSVLECEGERTHPFGFKRIVFYLPDNHLTLHFLTFVLIIWEFHTVYLDDFTILLKSSNASVTWLTLWNMPCTWEKDFVLALVKFKTWQLEFSELRKLPQREELFYFQEYFPKAVFNQAFYLWLCLLTPIQKLEDKKFLECALVVLNWLQEKLRGKTGIKLLVA